jgi:hypothetical protein
MVIIFFLFFLLFFCDIIYKSVLLKQNVITSSNHQLHEEYARKISTAE